MPVISIHDPIHGTIEVSPAEIKLIDARAFQRLRHIKQLGFAELAFPGATHSRYAHSLGAMQMATRMLDQLLPPLGLPDEAHRLLRQAVRLAVLFHDLGHPPMSHVSERAMPPVGALGLEAWQLPEDDSSRRATHEDYTLKLLLDSELTQLIDTHLGDAGQSGALIAALVAGRRGPLDASTFVHGGQDLLPLLSQIVSSEMDADRMDYLRRDAYYCGVSYGNFDHLWLVRNLCAVAHEGSLVMALQHKGIWAFENFLLARYHMFLSVYYHHTPICFDHLLGNYYQSSETTLPTDSETYLQTDDVQLLMQLRQAENKWARHVVRRRPYRLLIETHDYGDALETAAISERLRAQNIDHFVTQSRGILSKYFTRKQADAPLLMVEPEKGRTRRIEDYTPLYERFREVVGITRIYCRPDQLAVGKGLLR
ncbi:MAG: HD domain-containing protein [Oxalobacteraceae bacterium]|nr:MAG: HD domain-containing protein [Oxalobacteraceae bacterium]